MKRPKIQPTGVEGAFGIEELFFSTTDRAGVIRSGNSVFVRLSRYPLEELLGAPHNIIRHPDMPRCVFKLLWDELLAGRTIAAYVKNLAADGSHYWVLALAIPIDDGFVSVRLKPSSAIFDTVQVLYESLLETEQASRERGDKPAEGMRLSGEALAEALGSLGFASYADFMHGALREEMRLRDEATAGLAPPDAPGVPGQEHLSLRLRAARAASGRLADIRGHLEALVTLQERLDQKASYADDLARRFKRAAMNTAIRASSFGSQTQALSTIAAHMGTSSRDVERQATSFRAQARATIGVLERNTFQLEAVRLGLETCERLCTEALRGRAPAPPPGAVRQELDAICEDLAAAVRRLLGDVSDSMRALGKDLGAMSRDSEGLRRTVLMLRFGQLAGVIETARLNAQETVGPLLAEIGTSIERAQKEFAELNVEIGGLEHRAAELPSMLRAVQGELAGVTDPGRRAA